MTLQSIDRRPKRSSSDCYLVARARRTSPRVLTSRCSHRHRHRHGDSTCTHSTRFPKHIPCDHGGLLFSRFPLALSLSQINIAGKSRPNTTRIKVTGGDDVLNVRLAQIIVRLNCWSCDIDNSHDTIIICENTREFQMHLRNSRSVCRSQKAYERQITRFRCEGTMGGKRLN